MFPLFMYLGSIIFDTILEIWPWRGEDSRPGWKRGNALKYFNFGRGSEVPKHGEQQQYLKKKREEELEKERAAKGE